MASLRKYKLIIALLAVAIAITTTLILLYPRLEYERVKSQTLEHLQQAFNDLPVPAQSKLAHQRYYGCTKCQFGGVIVTYSASIPPEDVRAFYRNYTSNSQWHYGGEWDGQNNAGQIVQLGLSADWLFGDGAQRKQGFTLLVDKGYNTIATSYSIQIVYTQDTLARSRECSPEVIGTCQDEWWEINSP